jgi:hypothetical protein
MAAATTAANKPAPRKLTINLSKSEFDSVNGRLPLNGRVIASFLSHNGLAHLIGVDPARAVPAHAREFTVLQRNQVHRRLTVKRFLKQHGLCWLTSCGPCMSCTLRGTVYKSFTRSVRTSQRNLQC